MILNRIWLLILCLGNHPLPALQVPLIGLLTLSLIMPMTPNVRNGQLNFRMVLFPLASIHYSLIFSDIRADYMWEFQSPSDFRSLSTFIGLQLVVTLVRATHHNIKFVKWNIPCSLQLPSLGCGCGSASRHSRYFRPHTNA